VNQGQGASAKLLQKAAGVNADGAIGPATLAAVRRRPGVLLDFCAHRGVRYATTVKAVVFGFGWARRLLACYAEAKAVQAATEPTAS